MSKYVKFSALVDEEMPLNKLLVDIIDQIDKNPYISYPKRRKGMLTLKVVTLPQ